MHLVVLSVGELEGQLGGLDVKGADPGLRPLQQILSAFQAHLAALQPMQLLSLPPALCHATPGQLCC